ncbi:thiosulfate oxidation carrier protein SoxY [Paracraurococcus ruber]|uniref:Ig-like SoxY domain-containing protein n=1 Tax=Paracraurococcus ruber TaxID=77675 RepID=A0ABS1D4L4_9PROT|nr:thiosulfate oxidation carrier protein SoxY [Paracraurococcus ruber]MBK1661390.1 hypothetical protein [Paracraurococcus ruber]TDG23911.1 sulfur oxidation protein SoxY [Paracraurococcus ruber]
MLPRRPLLLALAALPFGARAAPSLEAAIRDLVGEARIEAGGIALRLPPLAENGGQVPVTVSVESPQTAADHVTHIHLLATRNPTPGLASFRLTPALARAEIQTRIRLAEDQQVVALAVLSDGRVRRALAETRVATGGCIG